MGRAKGKGKRKRSPSPEPVEEFINNEAEIFYDKRGNFSVVKGTAYDFDEISKEGFADVTAKIHHQRWREFCELNEKVHLPLVRKFYANLETNKSCSTLTSLYQGNTITLNPDIILGFLVENLPTDVIAGGGYKIDYGKDALKNLPEYNDVDKFKCLFEDQYADLDAKNASHLTVQNRLLHHIIVNTIIPHEGSGTTVNKVHLCLLWCLNKNIKIDLCYAIFAHMVYARKASRHAYPYAMFITRYIMLKFVTITSESLVTHCRNFKLHQLFKKDNNGKWTKTPSNSVKKEKVLSISVTTGESSKKLSFPETSSQVLPSSQSTEPSEAPSEQPSEQQNDQPSDSVPTPSLTVPSSSTAPTAPSSSSSPGFDHHQAHTEVMGILNLINTNFDDVNVRLDAMDSRIEAVNQRVNGITRFVTQGNQSSQSYGDTNMRMLLNLEQCHRHLFNQMLNLNRRMYYMDVQVSNFFHLDQPPPYAYDVPVPEPPAPRDLHEVPNSSSHPSGTSQRRSRGGMPPPSNGN